MDTAPTLVQTSPPLSSSTSQPSSTPNPHVTPLDLSPNHFKLLYLISLYAIASNSTRQNERWVRHVPLLVLMFEGIVRGKLGFDYAPNSVRLSFKGRTLRRWINISREGVAAINDLWELRLVHGLKLSSDDFQPITAYQVAPRGVALLTHLPPTLQSDVDSFVFPPSPVEKKPLLVSYDGALFYLRSGGYSKQSAITDSEDVSYVSSPFLPQCLRATSAYYQVEERNNRHRAAECAQGLHSSLVLATTEAMTLANVHALVGEWVPFGANQIVALNERIGALDRCQGGILTSIVDRAPTDVRFHVPLGQTNVRILDFDFVRFINFEAESHFPEANGIVQVESFGMHLNADGSLLYGMTIEAIMARGRDDVSIDALARLLVDVHQDSSLLVNDLLSRYQVSLLEMLYLGDSCHRNKFNCLLASSITPKLPAQTFVHHPLYANELAQVLGDVYAAYDITDDDLLVVGRSGCLFAGPNIVLMERFACAFVALVSRDVFIKNFFARTFVLDATLKEIRRLIHRVHLEPATALEVREKLAVVSKDTILLAETLEYLLDSLEDIPVMTSSFSENPLERRLTHVLALETLKTQTTMRCHDSIKLMENTMHQLEQLQMIADSTATKQLEVACQRVHFNTQGLMRGAAQYEQSRLTLQALSYVVGGLFVFDGIDRLSGGTWNVHLPLWFRETVVDCIVAKPFVWYAIQLVVLAGVVGVVHALTKSFATTWLGWSTVRVEVNRRIHRQRFAHWLALRTLQQTHATRGGSDTRLRTFVWHETDPTLWRDVVGPTSKAPTIALVVDERHAFLLFASVRFDAKSAKGREAACAAALHTLLTQHDVFDDRGEAGGEGGEEEGHTTRGGTTTTVGTTAAATAARRASKGTSTRRMSIVHDS